jgi:putative nucleotidyltransferase with HDIG domain
MTLRFANSSLYGTLSKITTIQQAVSLVGMSGMRNLITAAAVSGCFPGTSCAGFDLTAFWQHSVATAVCAKVLARHLHLNQDIAFTVGLLHDIGRLVLTTGFTHQYEAVLAYRAEHDCYLLEAERTVLQLDHAVAGKELAERWNLPDAIHHAIAGHHDLEPFGGGSTASLVHIANAIVHALDLGNTEDDLVPPVSLVAWHGAGLDGDTYMKVFRETELEFNALNLTP